MKKASRPVDGRGQHGESFDIHHAIKAEGRRLRADLNAVLNRHGRPARRGSGDFWTDRPDEDMPFILVGIYDMAFLTVDIARCLQAVVRRRALDWRVTLMLGIDKPGVRLTYDRVVVTRQRIEAYWQPARLRRVFGDAFTWGERGTRVRPSGKRTITVAAQRRREWRSLYRALIRLMAPLGKNDILEPTDYFIVGDDMGGRDHKICIFRMELLTPNLVQRIQALLRARFPRWSVLFQPEIVHPSVSIPTAGIRVHPRYVAANWNARRLRRDLGPAFVWPDPIAVTDPRALPFGARLAGRTRS